MFNTKSIYAAGALTGLFACGASSASANDLGVLTSIDVCSAVGSTGLTISSETNCLTITGEVEYTFVWGDYDTERRVIDDLAYAGSYDVFIGDGQRDWESTVEFKLKTEARSQSDFGRVRGVITLEGTDETVIEDLLVDDVTNEVVLDEAYLAIGDKTVLMVGLKDTIVEDGDDTSFTFQEMFNEDEASGVGYNSDATNTDIDDEGHVIQIVSDLENGFIVGVALEDIDDRGTLVGIVQYSSDILDTHLTVLADEVLRGSVNDWAVHAAATADFDDLRVRGAAAFNNDGWWNVLGTADAELDMFTLAVGAEATSEDEIGMAASVAAEVTKQITLNLGSRAFREADSDLTIDTVFEAEYEFTEAITLIAGGGYIYESDTPVGITYGRASLEWNSNDIFEAELTARVHSRPGSPLGHEITFGAKREFE